MNDKAMTDLIVRISHDLIAYNNVKKKNFNQVFKEIIKKYNLNISEHDYNLLMIRSINELSLNNYELTEEEEYKIEKM